MSSRTRIFLLVLAALVIAGVGYGLTADRGQEVEQAQRAFDRELDEALGH